MQVDRHVERLGAREDRPEALIVDELPMREPVDHRALEAELFDAARKLVRGRGRIGGRQRREARIARRAGVLTICGEPVVDAARELDRAVGDLLQRGRRMRQHLDVDAGRVHVLQPRFAGIRQRLEHMRRRKGIAPGEQSRSARGRNSVPRSR